MINLLNIKLAQGISPPKQSDLGLPNVGADANFLSNALGVAFGLAAALAILIIVIAGLNIAKSDGNPEEISKGKRTIILAVIGLGIAMIAEALVYFVLRSI